MLAICLLNLTNIFHHISSNTALHTFKSTWPFVQHICWITKIITWLFLTIIARSFVLDVFQDSEFASLVGSNLWKKLHLRCLTEVWIHFCSHIYDFRKKIHLKCLTVYWIRFCSLLDVYQLEVLPIFLLNFNIFHHISSNIVHG